MSERNRVTSKVTTHRLSTIATSAACHLLATVIYFTAFGAMFLTKQSLGILEYGLTDAMLRPDIVAPLVIIFGLSACAWALTFIIFRLAQSHTRAAKMVTLKKARGTIIAETLIVLPVFFLLTFGLAQLAVNSIAGLLTTLASYEVTRTLAVWAGEEGNSRAPGGQVTKDIIREKARLVAAGVIAPVVPELASGIGCQEGTSLPAMRRGMVAAGFISAPLPVDSVWSMSEAYGTSRFVTRGPTKLTLAYCAIDVTWTGVYTDPRETNRKDFSSTVKYNHPAVFPLVGPIFARNPGVGPWATTYVTTMERTYTMTQYVTPNVWTPRSTFMSP